MSYGNITAEGNNAGGIVGSNRLGEGLVKNSYAKGEIEGIYYVGGLVGDNVGYIEDSYAEGDVNGVDTVGGLVGGSYEGKIENSYAKGDVKGDHRHVGGLTGILQDGEINNSYATGKVFAGANHEENDHGDAGGLVGAVYNNAIITNSHATGEVESNGFNVGGLVGQLHGIIENSYAEGNVEGSRQIGGLVGSMHESTVENSYARGNAGGFDVIGGLVGENYNGIIETSFATGNVNAEGYYYEEAEAYFVNSGGLVGQNEGEIKRCYSTGDVSDIEDAGGVNLGGFVGRNREPGVISESFSTGKVTSHYDTGQVGGFTGFNYHIVHNSYWDIDTSGYDTSGGGEGRTTEQMQAGNANDQIDGENIYEDWDDSIWDFGSDNEYPGFYWE